MGLLRVLAGAVLISFAAVFVSLSGVAPAPAAFYRLVIGAVALMGFAVLRRERLRLEPRFVIYVLLAGLAFAADLVIWHLSIYRVGPGIATLLPNFQVVLMTLAGWLIWRERLTPRIAVAIGVAVVGLVLLLMAAPQAGHGRFMAGIGYGLGAAVAYTAYLLFLRLAGSSTSRKAPAFFIGSVSVVAAVGAGLWIVLRGESFVVPFGMAWVWLAFYGLGCQALGWLLISTGLPRVPAALAGLLLLLQPTLTFAWDHLIFGRRFTLLELAGAALALIGLYLGLRWRSAKRLDPVRKY
jgi:drug/metabolite transporter (DMT)-like permease